MTSVRDYVERKTPLDAMLTSWERACAWSLLHPELAPVAAEPRPGLVALAYVLPLGEPELLRVVDTWLEVVRGYGRFDSARQYWILGQATRQRSRAGPSHATCSAGGGTDASRAEATERSRPVEPTRGLAGCAHDRASRP